MRRLSRKSNSVEQVEQALQNVALERIALNPESGFAPGEAEKVDIDEVCTKLKNEVAATRILREKYGQSLNCVTASSECQKSAGVNVEGQSAVTGLAIERAVRSPVTSVMPAAVDCIPEIGKGAACDDYPLSPCQRPLSVVR